MTFKKVILSSLLFSSMFFAVDKHASKASSNRTSAGGKGQVIGKAELYPNETPKACDVGVSVELIVENVSIAPEVKPNLRIDVENIRYACPTADVFPPHARSFQVESQIRGPKGTIFVAKDKNGKVFTLEDHRGFSAPAWTVIENGKSLISNKIEVTKPGGLSGKGTDIINSAELYEKTPPAVCDIGIEAKLLRGEVPSIAPVEGKLKIAVRKIRFACPTADVFNEEPSVFDVLSMTTTKQGKDYFAKDKNGKELVLHDFRQATEMIPDAKWQIKLGEKTYQAKEVD